MILLLAGATLAALGSKAPAPMPIAVPGLLDPGELVIERSRSTHDFGDSWIGQTLEHTFEVKTKGPGATTITQATPT